MAPEPVGLAAYAAAFEGAPIGVCVVGPTGRIVEVNPVLCDLLGRSRDELLGLTWRELTHPDDLAADERALEAALSSGSSRIALEKRFVAADGTPIWVRINVSLLRDTAGREAGGIVHVEDITARRRLERQLHEASKLEAIGRLAGGVAHDFNNMLLVVRGYTHLLLQRLAEDDSARADAVEIDLAAERAAKLVAQLLAFGRRQVLQPRRLDLNELVRENESLLRWLVQAEVELRIDSSAAVEPVRADPAQLERVLVNLAINGGDAISGAGRIEIATGMVRLGKLAAGEAGVTPGRYARLTVRDDGAGMAAETLARVCEPFFTTKSEGFGTGLGLATVHGIVSQSGGGLTIESAPGAGTTVQVYLPLAAAGVEPAPGGGAAAS